MVEEKGRSLSRKRAIVFCKKGYSRLGSIAHFAPFVIFLRRTPLPSPQESLPQARTSIVYFALQNGRSTSSYKSLDGRANLPETRLIRKYLAVKSKNQPRIPVPRQQRESKKIKN
ncbi:MULTISPECIES: hypothetical protein [unclassified Microcoleus]|uniref:hypothetical protein n=1 Tax=unclassified Microcoleus TaxID=2642155 RepID=UPI002FD24E64